MLSDAVTVSPYLGVGSLKPVFDLAEETGRGVFVLAATSNPEAVSSQSIKDADGVTVAQGVVNQCAAINASYAAEGRAGNVGVVVGATLKHPPVLDQLAGPVLLPGVGAQGATAQDVKAITIAAPELGFANVSRSVLSRGPQVRDLQEAVKEALAEIAF